MLESGLNILKSGSYALFVYLGIEHGIVEALAIMMMVDSGLGVAKAMRLKQRLSFKILLWGMITKLSLLVIPMIIALMGKALFYDFSFFVVAVLNILVVSEGISCITNIITIKTGKEVKNTDYITMLLHTIRRALDKLVRKTISSIEDEIVPKK